MSSETIPRTKFRGSEIHALLTVAALSLAVFHLVLLYTQRDTGRTGEPDFKAFYTGAYIVRLSRGSQLYDYDLQAQIQNRMFPSSSRPGEALPYDHPPFELLVFLPLASLPYLPAYYVWVAITVGLTIVSGGLLGRNLEQLSGFWGGMPFALIMCLFPFLFLLVEGQDSALALIILVLCWSSLRRGSDALAGFFLGMGLFKFQIFIPITVILACWRARILRGFCVTTAIAGIASAILVRPAGLVSYFRLIRNLARATSGSASGKYLTTPISMPNLRGLAYGMVSHGAHSLEPFSARMLLIALILLSGLTLVWAAHEMRAIRFFSAETTDLAFAFAVTLGLFLSFHLQPYDLTLLAVPFALVLNLLVSMKTHLRPRQLALARLIVLFYVTPLYLLLIIASLTYLLGAAVLAFAILVSRELSEFGQCPAKAVIVQAG